MNNFDLRKFLSENQLTPTSKILEGWKVRSESSILNSIDSLISKFENVSFRDVNDSIRVIQDYITLIQNGGGWQISELVEHILGVNGIVKRGQVVWEHRTPLNTYKAQLVELIKGGDSRKVYDFLYEKTDYVLVHRVEDLLISNGGYTCKIPEEGDRYGNCGIIVAGAILPVDKLDVYGGMARHAKIAIARMELKEWVEKGFIVINDSGITIDYSVDVEFK